MAQQQLVYHESQVAALCGVHCLNTLLQGPFFSEVDLASVRRALAAAAATGRAHARRGVN
jgi:ataxin-3